MELYKYTSTENGINILSNLEIRFTQPNSLNDVFDMFPNLLTEISEDTFESIFKEFIELGYFEKMWDDTVQNFYNSMRKYPLFSKKEIADKFLKDLFNRNFLRGRPLPEVLYEIIKGKKDEFGKIMIQQFIELVNNNVGVLSISEINDDLKMWGYYADSHRGIVICFNRSHPFFLDIQKVKYVNDRITFNINDATFKDNPKPQDIFCVKSSDWEFEKGIENLVSLAIVKEN